MTRIAMLGTGLIGRFYTESLHGKRSRDRVQLVYSRSEDRAAAFAEAHGIPQHTTDLEAAVSAPDIDTVIIGVPNHLHEQAVLATAKAGKAVLCTKPLGRNAAEALRMLEAVEQAGVFHAYLEDLVYTPKTLKALDSVRGGMDLRDEVAGTEGTIWLNHWLRTGMEIFSAVGQSGYVAEKAESDTGWLFPVGDEAAALGYVDMFTDVLDSLDQQSTPMEDFYDGYVVNAIIDAAYASVASKQWESVELPIWRGRKNVDRVGAAREYDVGHLLIKEEKMPDGTTKLILRHKQSGEISQRLLE